MAYAARHLFCDGNEDVVTMQFLMIHQKLHCYTRSLDLAKKLPGLIKAWPAGSGYLADQLKRAVSSIVLNIAEGNGRTSVKERGRFFCIARGSATEVSAIMDVAYVLDMVDQSEYDYFQVSLLQIVKMLYKLS